MACRLPLLFTFLDCTYNAGAKTLTLEQDRVDVLTGGLLWETKDIRHRAPRHEVRVHSVFRGPCHDVPG